MICMRTRLERTVLVLLNLERMHGSLSAQGQAWLPVLLAALNGE